MTSVKYQEEFDTLKGKGYFPSCLQGGGSGSATRYTAIFVKREDPIKREFHATGPVANADIDNLFKQIMQKTPARQMSVAIVRIPVSSLREAIPGPNQIIRSASRLPVSALRAYQRP